MDNDPGHPSGTVAPEKEYTAEQLAQLQAAMMEELGLGRVDNLHLADKGPPVEYLQPLKKPKKIANTAIAAWHNLHLEEPVDPTKADLDNIADGQLYRLRRGASSGGSRGNSAPRGGHFSHGHRGGSRGGRGGYEQGGNGFVRHDRQDKRRFDSASTPKSFFQKARDNMKSSTHVDRVMARLRGAIESSALNPPTHRHPGHVAGAPPAISRQSKGNTHNRPSQPVNPQPILPEPVLPRVMLDNGDGFLKWAGIGESVTSKLSAKPVVTTASQAQLTPRTDRSGQAKSVPVTSVNGVTSHAQDGASTNSLRSQGLLGSKWGPSPEQPAQSQPVPASQLASKSQDISALQQSVQPQAITSPQKILKFADELGLKKPSQIPSRSIFDERKTSRRVPVKIMKNGSPIQRDGVAIMKKKNEADEFYNIVLIDSSNENILVDEAVNHEAVIELKGSIVTYRAAQHTGEKPPTWKIIFQLPIYAASFTNFVFLERQSSGYIPRAASDREPRQTDHSSNLQTSYSAPDAIDASITQNQQTEATMYHDRQISELSRSHYHPGDELENVPKTGAFAQDTESESIEMLVSLGNDDQTYVPSSAMNSDILDLLEADDSILIEALFGFLGGDDDFFDLMSSAVVTQGGKPVSQISSDELMSDPKYQSVLQTGVFHYLSSSETFTMLPENHCAAYVQNKSRKVMQLAISRRGLVLESITSVAEDNTAGTCKVEDLKFGLPNKQTYDHKDNIDCQPMSRSDENSVKVEDPQPLELAQDTRIKYSPDSLLNLRSHAIAVEISEHPPRERRLTRVATPQVTTVKEWQDFHAKESKSSTPVPKTSLIAPVQVADLPHVYSQEPKPPIGTSSEVHRAAPAAPAANLWQAFAAEELKTSSEDQSTCAAVPAVFPAGEEPQAVQSTPKATISTASVSSTVPSTMISSQQGQHTNDTLWAAILGTVGSSKTVVQPKPQVPKSNLHHRPSKSDVNDRLAKDFSGLNLNTQTVTPDIKPTIPVFDKSMPIPQPEVSVRSTPTPRLSRGPPNRNSTPAEIPAVSETSLNAPQTDIKVQSTPESSLMPRGQSSLQSFIPIALTPASQAMQYKITAALKQPLVASPRLSPANSFTRPSSAAGSMQDTEPQLKKATDVNKEMIGSLPVTQVKIEPELKSGTSTSGVLPPPIVMAAKSQEAPPADHEGPVKNPASSVLATSSGCRLAAAAEPVNPSNAFDETLSKVLNGAPGLSASKWADECATPQVNDHPTPRTHSSSFQSTQQTPYYPQGPHLNQVPAPGYTPMAPVLATVVVPDGAGGWKEVTGMMKTGSVPIVAHAPIPQSGDTYVENVRPSNGHSSYSGYTASSHFPVRPSSFQHHSSFSSANPESKINPVAPSFKPSPQRSQGSTPVGQKQPLTPSKNIQSQLQSRLNSSMTGPRMSYLGPQL
ncbi:hypothetical protein ONS96_012448 [Cadophora gregata f. sp. sojae]|nr:hypothetical protein ONS96_012448 [Cadophora gregata f. sp. sojae]